MKVKLKTILNFLFELALTFLLLQQNIFPSELTFISLLLTIVFGIILIIHQQKIHFNPYLITFLLFIFILSLNCFARNGQTNEINRIILILMQFLSNLCIYNYLIQIKNPKKFMHLYSIIAIISLTIIIFLVGPSNAVASRLGHNGSGGIVSYYIFNTPIYKSSNGTANFCAIAVLFFLYFIKEEKRSKFNYILIILLSFGIILCGSRKGILTLGIFILYFCFFNTKGINFKKITLFAAIPVISFILLFKVPIVYNTIGMRVESMVLNMFNQENRLDGNSYLMRESLTETALSWISKKPFFGHGINVFENKVGYGAENNLLQILVETGIIGAITYYSFLIPLTINIIKNKRKSKIIDLFSILIIAILIQDYGSVTYSWQHMTIWYSIFFAINKNTKQKNENSLNLS